MSQARRFEGSGPFGFLRHILVKILRFIFVAWDQRFKDITKDYDPEVQRFIVLHKLTEIWRLALALE